MSRALEDLLSLHNCGTVDELNGYIGALEDSALRAEAALREARAAVIRAAYHATSQTADRTAQGLISEMATAIVRALSGARPE